MEIETNIDIDAGGETEMYEALQEPYAYVAQAEIVDNVTVNVGDTTNPSLERIKEKDRILKGIERIVPHDILKGWQEGIEYLREVKDEDGIRWF